MRTIDYKDFLREKLKDPKEAAGYLTACLEEGEDVFLLGLRDVTEVLGGISALARSTNLNRENLYDMLSKEGNPRLSSISAVLDALGIKVQFTVKLQGTKAA